MAFSQQEGQVPQALQYLTGYLRQANVEQTAQNQQDAINQSISDAAQTFKSLGPDATLEDSRAVFFDALGKAAQNKVGPQTAPLLQNLYNEADKYIQAQKTQNQESAYVSNTASLYGIPTNMAQGMGAQGLSNFVTQGQNEARQQKITNPDGSTSQQSYLTKYNRNTNSFGYIPSGQPMMIDATTYATGAAQKLAEHEATRNYDIAHPLHEGGTTVMTSGGGYMGTIPDGKGGSVQVPLQGIKGKPGYWYFANGQMNQYDPLAQGSPSKYTDPNKEAGVVLSNQLKQNQLTGNTPANKFKNSQAAAKGLIDILAGARAISYSSYFNSNGQMLPGATSLLNSQIDTRAIRATINGMKDPTAKEAALQQYGVYQVSRDPQKYDNAYNRVKSAFDTKNSEMWAIQQMIANYKGAKSTDEATKMNFDDYSKLNEGYKVDIANSLNLKK